MVHGPIFFGPATSKPELRYDAPDGSYKVLYVARSLETAFGETLVRTPSIPYVLSSAVVSRAFSQLVTTRSVRLYPLLDAGVSSHGLSFSDLHGDAYGKTWAISGEIHSTTDADGILYTSRFDNQLCVALFDRAADAIAETSVTGQILTPELATRLAEHFGKQYVET
jgi:hypothetical protein